MEIWYRTSIRVVPEAACGVWWNGPVFGISWPESVRIISGKACALEDY